MNCKSRLRRSQWPRGLRRGSAAARLLGLWVRILPGGVDVCCECCVLSGRGLCDELISRLEESYRMWCVVVRDLETRMRRPWPALGRSGGVGVGGGSRLWPCELPQLTFLTYFINDFVDLPFCTRLLHLHYIVRVVVLYFYS
jgi:hypothetical protein